MKQKKKRRKFLLIAAALVVALVLLVVFLPGLLSIGLGRAIAERAIAKQVNGAVKIERVSLSWLGAQSIEGLSITDGEKREAVRLDVRLEQGLLGIALGNAPRLDLVVDGAIHGALRADGSTSFGDLVRSGPAASAPPEKKEGGAITIGVPAATVAVRASEIALAVPGPDGPETIFLRDLEGEIRWVPGGRSSIEIETTSVVGDRSGTLAIRAEADGLFDGRGTLAPKGAVATIELVGKGLVVPYAPQVEEIRRLHVTAKTTDLAQGVDIAIEVDTILEASDETSGLVGAFTIARPFDEKGSFVLDPGAVSGSLEGHRVPTGLLQPFVATSGLDLDEDLGPLAEVSVTFGAAGELKAAPSGAAHSTPVRAEIRTDLASLDLSMDATLSGAIENGAMRATLTVTPSLVRRLAGLSITQPANVALQIDRFSAPAAAGAGGAPDFEALSLEGRLAVVDPIELRPVPREDDPSGTEVAPGNAPGALVAVGEPAPASAPSAAEQGILIEPGAIAFSSESLSRGVRFDGALSVAGGRVAVNGSVGRAGEPDLAVALESIDSQRIAMCFAPSVASLLAGPLTGALSARPVEGGTRVRADLALAHLTVAAEVDHAQKGLDVRLAKGELRATPALAEALQRESARPVRLGAPAKVSFEVAPLFVPRDVLSGERAFDDPVEIALGGLDAVVAHESLQDAIRISEGKADVVWRGGASSRTAITATAQLARDEERGRIGSFACDLVMASAAALPHGTIDLTDVDVAALEAVLREGEAALDEWTGRSGSFRVAIEGTADAPEAMITADLPSLRGSAHAGLKSVEVGGVVHEMLTVDEAHFDVILAKRMVDALFGFPTAAERAAGAAAAGSATGEGAGAEAIWTHEDVALVIDVRAIELPFAALEEKPFDPGAALVAARVSSGRVQLAGPSGVRSTIDGVEIELASEDLAEGVRVTLDGTAREGESGAPGRLAMTGRLHGLVTEESKLSGKPLFDANLEAAELPTSIFDGLLEMHGALVDAIGPQVAATAVVRELTAETGVVEIDLRSSNGRLTGRVRRGEGILFLTKPIEGELAITPPLSQRLLSRIHPIFADVRTVEQPLRATVAQKGVLPADGDLRRLNADIEITVGKVEFDSGSTLLQILSLFETARDVVPGEIEPIRAKITNGVVTYEQFSVKLDKYVMRYSGKIDLPRGTIDLRTELPLGALAGSFHELEGWVDDLVVPLVTRGTFEHHETKIDPNFDLAAALGSKGLQKGIGELLGELLKKK